MLFSTMDLNPKTKHDVIKFLNVLQRNVLKSNLVRTEELSEANFKCLFSWKKPKLSKHALLQTRKRTDYIFRYAAFLASFLILSVYVVDYLLSIRCFVPNNYVIWESTRPISNCRFCAGINRPIILSNKTQNEFLQFAYSPHPIILKNAIAHWPARDLLTFQYLKEIYNKSNMLNDECQFLPFKSNFASIKEFLDMPESQVSSGNPSWYVGFSNCQSSILNKLRELYPRPHFLPEDAEIPNTDYVFLGYNEGAVMHLDYINRLMWQAQLVGNKTWNVCPTPECDSECSGFSFYVEQGDFLLIDTRIWYHETSVEAGQFSITIQSEYG